MNLPRLLVLTDRHQAGRPLVDVVAAAVDGGARAVVLREKDLPRVERARLAAELRPILTAAGGVLIAASDPTIPADGVHLAANDPTPVPRPGLVGRSCHTPAQLVAAATEGCNWATLSPIFASISKPGYGPPLGSTSLRDGPLPVYALGGIDASRAAACVAAGAVGVAVMGDVMRAEHPETVVAALLRALDAEAGR